MTARSKYLEELANLRECVVCLKLFSFKKSDQFLCGKEECHKLYCRVRGNVLRRVRLVERLVELKRKGRDKRKSINILKEFPFNK